MEKLQFSAIVMLTLLTLQLSLLLPAHVQKDQTLNHSRWYLALGTGVLALQFLLQYIFGFREMGITQAVMVNMAFFVPCSILFSMTMLNIQQQGHVNKQMWVVAIAATLITWVLLGSAVIVDGKTLQEDSQLLRRAEYATGLVYCVTQIYFSYHLLRNEQRLNRSLNSYYDYTSKRVLLWMRRVMMMLTILALGVPFLIFCSGVVLKIYSVTIFLTIFYLVTSFAFFCVSNDAAQVKQAEQADEEKLKTPVELTEDDLTIVARKVEKWVADRRYMQSGLTIQRVADDIKLPRNKLAMWLKTTEWELFNPWMNSLRIEEAKNMLMEHNEWTNDAVARQCGFSSRNYFQQVFKKSTGLTPAEFVKKTSLEQSD